MNDVSLLESNDLMDSMFFENIRNKYYSRLDRNNIVYFDFAGSSIHNEELLDNYINYMNNNIIGNPHSNNVAAQNSESILENVRYKLKKFFNATNFEVVFTANTSNAIKLIGENLNYELFNNFYILKDNHNSMHGLRLHAKKNKINFTYFDQTSNIPNDDNKKLICFPYQSNATGAMYADSYYKRNENEILLVDMAAAVSHQQIDLDSLNYDFAVFSVNKLLGFPTGLGCLFINKVSMKYLQKKYFSGGSAAKVYVENDLYKLHDDYRQFEDGTVNFAVQRYVKDGLLFLEEIGMNRIHSYINSLQKSLYNKLISVKHNNSLNLIKINEYQEGSGIINFDVFDYKGKKWDCSVVDQILSNDNICIRSGFHCNSYHIEKCDPTLKDGSLRISLSFINVVRDIDYLIESLKMFLNTGANYGS